MNTQLITQSSLDEVGLQLDDLASDLAKHADGSLSVAHSINAIHFTVPTVDAYGNDVTVYYDSAGNVVGDYYLRFSVDGVVYYAPARKSTAPVLDGQPPTDTNLASEETNEALNGRGTVALATQFRGPAVASLVDVRMDVLIPHTRLGHWEAHAPVRAVPRITLDSAGDSIGRYTLIWQFNGAKFEIPCDIRLGGPPQKPRAVTVTPNDIHVSFGAGQGYQHIPPIAITCTAQGTQPFTFIWEIQISPNAWTKLTEANGSSTGPQTAMDHRAKVSGVASNSPNQSILTLTSLNTKEGGNSAKIRCVVSNGSGSVSAIASLYATDKTSCAIFSASCEAGYCSPRYLLEAVRFQIGVHRKWRFAREEWGGYMVLGTWLGRLIKHERWYSKLIFVALVKPLHEGMTLVNRGLPLPLHITVIAGLVRLSFVATYYLRRSKAEASIEAIAPLDLMKLYKQKLRQLRDRESAARRSGRT